MSNVDRFAIEMKLSSTARFSPVESVIELTSEHSDSSMKTS